MAWTDREDQALRTAAGRWRAEGIALRAPGAGRLSRGSSRRSTPSSRSVYYLARPGAGPQSPAPPRPDARRFHSAAAGSSPGTLSRASQMREGPSRRRANQRGRRSPAARWSWRPGPGPDRCSNTVGVHAPTPPLKGQIVLLRADRPLLNRDRRARQELPGPARRRPDPDRRHRRRRRFRQPADCPRSLATFSTRPCGFARCWARPYSKRPGPGLRPGSIDTKPYIGAAPGLREPVHRHRPQASRFAARAGHRRARRRSRSRPAAARRSCGLSPRPRT